MEIPFQPIQIGGHLPPCVALHITWRRPKRARPIFQVGSGELGQSAEDEIGGSLREMMLWTRDSSMLSFGGAIDKIIV